jgi:hypothetical protein
MARLTFPVTRDGLSVPVLIGLDGYTTTARMRAGQPALAPVLSRGLLDTGSNPTAVARWVLQSLGVPRYATGTSQTASGTVPVALYRVSLEILDPGQPGGAVLTLPSLVVTELTSSLSDADVLVGLDVLLTCGLLLEGPARKFTLDF